MSLLEVRQATVGYAHRAVLRDVAFSLPAGSACCLLGANGCGKTTLMRAILGVLPLLSGDIVLAGTSLRRYSDAQRASVMAWVPQAHEGAFAFSVLDMVLMGMTPHMSTFAVPGQQERDAALQQLTVLGIAHLAERRWNLLSGGERQLVLIARALAQKPRVLLLDEPASSLDFGHQIDLLETLVMLKQQGMTLLMSTHHPLHARAIADSVVMVEPDGQVTQGAPAEQLHTDRLAALYRVTPAQIHRHLYGTH
ncbi:ABC transporter ATP-binding protein [Candidatus Symbiopectobacterium sp. NZEC135]|uniref:ABC transporter ATP-binding protein n=1 Tax=Candidatus Symbiopectobacterium sp. NZEC135 TaxID=2820471 RepID=UPI002227D47C|nr:ABC transporter ATP-binding protein [Candidatus Symbiopectobacterium sp. NZEC135]MCW2481908.1 ABC transporter ATP-binding protein [Candidatus Symbiopectobacterium sp. NZEC135]